MPPNCTTVCRRGGPFGSLGEYLRRRAVAGGWRSLFGLMGAVYEIFGDSWRCIWVFLIIHLDSKATQAVTAPLTQLGTGDCQVVPMFGLVV